MRRRGVMLVLGLAGVTGAAAAGFVAQGASGERPPPVSPVARLADVSDDRRGRRIGGPSPFDLNGLAIELRDGDVYVDPAKVIVGACPGCENR